MNAMKQPNKKLSELLERLETKANEGYARVNIQGRAVGKSKDSLHVAVESGVVAIPLDEIEAIQPIPGRTANEISIDVHNGGSITYLRRMSEDGPVCRQYCTGIDTTTSSGGVADQTDDYREYCWHYAE